MPKTPNLVLVLEIINLKPVLIVIRELNVIQKTNMITVQILEDTDTIQPTDWCRPLRLTTMSGGMSDYYSFESCYSGLPENNVKIGRAHV